MPTKEVRNGLIFEKKTVVNTKTFHTPTMMLTYSFRDNNPRPWLKIPNCSVMTNAYDILQNGRLEKRVRDKGIHKELGLKNEICVMDSGGFQFISRGEEEDIDPLKIIDLQNASNTDIAVGLDYPILQDFSLEKAKKLSKKSLENIKLSIKNVRNSIEVMPVLHGTTPEEIQKYFVKVEKISDFKIWGIGGLVPQMKQSSTSHTRYFNIIDRVMEARKQLNTINEELLLHVFGVGSPLAGLLFLLAGADSIESISWIMNAKYFLVYQDKIGARKVSKQTTMCTTSVKWNEYNCTCPICRNKDLEEIEQKMKMGGNEGFKNRAMHNAYVYQQILVEAKEAISEHRLTDFCIEKLGKHRFFKGILKYALEKVEKYHS
ncbi:MAG: tRNA-guanine transglycosylase [Candidatus Heimdallarchaeota archaeon]|nr:tRNA-guanine transglycosylase [Candidatus Heimdallarchaeota archaeon]MBY8993794.1 tRNA-guanine transglycosylase [Candidatus Heimdallarchaeota archaeon]